MVDAQTIADLRSLRQDIADQMSVGPASVEKMESWALVAGHLIGQLESPRCEECGKAMRYEPTLQAYTCDHAED